MRKTTYLLAAFATSLFLGCSSATLSEDEGMQDYEAEVRWSGNDVPEDLIERPMERRVDYLPDGNTVGGSGVWPGSYWPTYQDSINYRWRGAGELSPAEKYERAFRAWGFVDAVRNNHGLGSISTATPCHENWSCPNPTDVCATERGEQTGFCAPSWTGLCHGWAPVSFLLPEPKYPVRVNGVTFYPNDIKALAILLYTVVDSNLIGGRCEETLDGQASWNPDCRDSNAGSFHVALSNIVGIGRRSFVLDRVYDSQVWNHPVVGFKVQTNRPIQVDEANYLVTGRGGRYERNPDARAFRHIDVAVDIVMESPSERDGALQSTLQNYVDTLYYSYVLELDSAGAIIGGEWIGNSVTNHPDFMWAPKGRIREFVLNERGENVPFETSEGLRSLRVHGLVNDSQRPNVVR